MTMKQTQTKLFDFSDKGLDFCGGSKSLFPNRFKCILNTGYNTQTVTSVTISDNQYTLSYGVAHGYKAGRVLKLNNTQLQLINEGEYVIDSVTENTVTITIDNGPNLLQGNFTTYVAPIGYQLMYESGLVQVYKIKALDNKDLYLRLAFQSTGSARNAILPCIGKSFDPASGIINDEYSYASGRSATLPSAAVPKWEFASDWYNTYDNYNFSQGYSEFGEGKVIGSLYHLIIMSNVNRISSNAGVINGFVPQSNMLNHISLDLPLLFMYSTPVTGNDISSFNFADIFCGYVGNLKVSFNGSYSVSGKPFYTPQATQSFLPTNIEPFNLTTSEPLMLYEDSTKQLIGLCLGGAYLAKFASSNQPTTVKSSTPVITAEIDHNNTCLIHNNGRGSTAFFVIPVEEII